MGKSKKIFFSTNFFFFFFALKSFLNDFKTILRAKKIFPVFGVGEICLWIFDFLAFSQFFGTYKNVLFWSGAPGKIQKSEKKNDESVKKKKNFFFFHIFFLQHEVCF